MTAARWSLAGSHCPWCELPKASLHEHLRCWPMPSDKVRDLLIALRGELEAERALADDLAKAVQAFLAADVDYDFRMQAALARWEAARA